MILKIQNGIMFEGKGDLDTQATRLLGDWLREHLKTTVTLVEPVPSCGDHLLPRSWQDALKMEVFEKVEEHLGEKLAQEAQLRVDGKLPGWMSYPPSDRNGDYLGDYLHDDDLGYRLKTETDLDLESWTPKYQKIPKEIIEWSICPHSDAPPSTHREFLGFDAKSLLLVTRYPSNLSTKDQKILRSALGDTFKNVNLDRVKILTSTNADYGAARAKSIWCNFLGNQAGTETRKLVFPKSWHDHFLASLGKEHETIELDQKVTLARACPHL